jgi:2-dehydro-3-deoxyphosphogluconate aldolase/(4S)-4-hydroxy-2-oxoglutarate aldolase
LKNARSAVIGEIERSKLIVVLRNVDRDRLIPCAAALLAGGVRCVEVAFDRSGRIPDTVTAGSIYSLAREFDGRLVVGAGTVSTVEQARIAADSGAVMAMSPDSFEDVIRASRRLGLVSVPGAFTPTEAAFAARCGADFVKLFPAGAAGPGYLRTVAVPLSDLRFLAFGGVTADNARAFIDAGAKGIGVSGGIVSRRALQEEDWDGVTAAAAAFVSALSDKKQ